MAEELKLPNNITSFSLNGDTYSQTWRKCGKSNCKCHTDWDHRHGPYWNRKSSDPYTKDKYIGKELPQWVIAAYLAVKKAKADIQVTITTLDEEINELREKLIEKENRKKTLERLKRGDHIFQEHYPILEEYGFLSLIAKEPQKTEKPKKSKKIRLAA